MSANCPRCRMPLEEAQVDTVAVRLCRACKGVLLAHADLMQILEDSWRAVSRQAAGELEFHAPEGWQKEMVMCCPGCGRPMEKYGYMGLAAIQIDRCDQCDLVWLDADELQNMVLALAKSLSRGEDAFRRERERRLTLGTAGGVPEDEQPQRDLGDIINDGVLASQVLVQLLRLLH